MKTKRVCSLVLAVVFVMASLSIAYAAPVATNSLQNINWDQRHDFNFHENLLSDLAKTYPGIAKTYSIGHSWQERQLWCIELSNSASKAKKTGIAIVGNIHGGEQEGAESAAYTAWWLATNYSKDKVAKNILDKYTVYIIPIMNPDGFVQSFVYNNRSNLRPTDANGDGKPFSDPYKDTNGDGIIAQVYVGAPDSIEKDRKYIGMESLDFDKNGKFGDDPRSSPIDLNRTFDYMWNRLDVDANPVIGANSYPRAGHDAASEPEVQAIQNFFITHPVYAMTTLHTGIQCVLWPWCYTPEPPKDAKFMESVANKMVKAFQDTTGRRMYAKQSYNDYPTSAEMIDWTYGRLGIHSYTMEVYAGGKSDPNGPIEDQCTWENDLPASTWEYIGTWNGVENVWFKNTTTAKMSGKAPPEQAKLVAGAKNALIEMIKSEPVGQGAQVPEWLKWEKGLQK